jgi:hypothetical protein
MNVTLKNNKLIIEIDADTTAAKLSATGKTRLIASSNGNQKTDILVKGQTVVIGLNAYIKNA